MSLSLRIVTATVTCRLRRGTGVKRWTRTGIRPGIADWGGGGLSRIGLLRMSTSRCSRTTFETNGKVPETRFLSFVDDFMLHP